MHKKLGKDTRKVEKMVQERGRQKEKGGRGREILLYTAFGASRRLYYRRDIIPSNFPIFSFEFLRHCPNTKLMLMRVKLGMKEGRGMERRGGKGGAKEGRGERGKRGGEREREGRGSKGGELFSLRLCLIYKINTTAETEKNEDIYSKMGRYLVGKEEGVGRQSAVSAV